MINDIYYFLMANIFARLFNNNKQQKRNLYDDLEAGGIGAKFRFGTQRNDAEYVSLSAVYSALEMISNAIAGLDINLFSKKDVKVKATNNNFLSRALRNMQISKFMFLKCLVQDLFKYGNAFAYIERNEDGSIRTLRFLPATDVVIFYTKKTKVLYYTSYLIEGKIYPVDMIHVYKNSENGVVGKSLFDFAARSLRVAQSTENAVKNFWDKGLASKYGLVHATSPMNPAQAKEARKFFETNSLDPDAESIVFLPFDLKFESLSNSAEEAQMESTRIFNICEIARWFCISPVLLGLMDKGNFSTLEQTQLYFLVHALQPIVELLESEFNRKLLPINDFDNYIEFDVDNVARADHQATANYLKTLKDAGIITTNEARELLNYAPIDGGDKIVIPYTDIQQNTVNEIE